MWASAPTRVGGFVTQPSPAYALRCPFHTRRYAGGTLSKQERAGDGSCGTKIPEPAQPVRGKTLYALSLVISRYRFRYCQAEFSPETFVPGEFLRISDQSTGQRKALSCLERVDRAEPGTGVEGTPDMFGRASSNGKTCRNSSEMKVDKC